MTTKHPLQAYRESFDPPMRRAELARKLNVARITVQRWETGDRKIEDAKVQSVSIKTGIPVAKLRPDLRKLLEVAR